MLLEYIKNNCLNCSNHLHPDDCPLSLVLKITMWQENNERAIDDEANETDLMDHLKTPSPTSRPPFYRPELHQRELSQRRQLQVQRQNAQFVQNHARRRLMF